MIFYTSDLHFGHLNILKWRTWAATIEEHNRTLIERWNETVGPEDEVIVLGDLVLGDRETNLPILGQLNGSIQLIPGNHDHVHPMHGQRKLDRWGPNYAPWVSVQPPVVRLPEWDLCHFPEDGDHTEEERYTGHRPERTPGRWLLHGHVHDLWKIDHERRRVNVGVDVWDFAPVPEERLLAIVQPGIDSAADDC